MGYRALRLELAESQEQGAQGRILGVAGSMYVYGWGIHYFWPGLVPSSLGTYKPSNLQP